MHFTAAWTKGAVTRATDVCLYFGQIKLANLVPKYIICPTEFLVKRDCLIYLSVHCGVLQLLTDCLLQFYTRKLLGCTFHSVRPADCTINTLQAYFTTLASQIGTPQLGGYPIYDAIVNYCRSVFIAQATDCAICCHFSQPLVC